MLLGQPRCLSDMRGSLTAALQTHNSVHVGILLSGHDTEQSDRRPTSQWNMTGLLLVAVPMHNSERLCIDGLDVVDTGFILKRLL